MTAEQRGTFFGNALGKKIADKSVEQAEIQVTAEQSDKPLDNALGEKIADRSLDQIAYSLPVQNGGRISLN